METVIIKLNGLITGYYQKYIGNADTTVKPVKKMVYDLQGCSEMETRREENKCIHI